MKAVITDTFCDLIWLLLRVHRCEGRAYYILSHRTPAQLRVKLQGCRCVAVTRVENVWGANTFLRCTCANGFVVNLLLTPS